MKKPSYYAILTADVRYSERLSSSEKLFFAEVTALSEKSGKCWASNRYFAELFNVAKSTVSGWVKSLEKEGFITVDYEKKGDEIVERVIKIPASKSSVGVQKTEGGSQKTDQGYSENPKRGYSEKPKYNTTSKSNTTSEDSARPRVNGVPLPPELAEVEGFEKKFEQYCAHLKENFNRWPSAVTTEVKFQKLAMLKREGNDPIQVIDQTLDGIQKSFYPIRNFAGDGDENTIDHTGWANAGAYEDYEEDW